MRWRCDEVSGFWVCQYHLISTSTNTIYLNQGVLIWNKNTVDLNHDIQLEPGCRPNNFTKNIWIPYGWNGDNKFAGHFKNLSWEWKRVLYYVVICQWADFKTNYSHVNKPLIVLKRTPLICTIFLLRWLYGTWTELSRGTSTSRRGMTVSRNCTACARVTLASIRRWVFNCSVSFVS